MNKCSLLFTVLVIGCLEMAKCQVPSDSLMQLAHTFSQADSSQQSEILLTLKRKATENPREVIEAARYIEDHTEQAQQLAQARYIFADAYYLLGNYDSAALYVEQAIDLFQNNNAGSWLATCYNLLGIILDVQGNYEQALQNYLKAIALHKQRQDQEGVNIALLNIGNIYSYQNDYRRAIDYYKKSLHIAQAIRDTIGISTALNNIGSSWQELDSLNLAMDYYQRSLAIAKKLGKEQAIALPLDGISHILLEQGELDQALENANYSYEIAQKYQNKNDQIYALYLLAKVHWTRSNASAAIRYATQGYELAVNSGAPLEAELLSELLADYHYEQGNYSNAYRYLSVQLAYQDSLFSVEKRRFISDMERTKAESEIEVLKKENELKLAKIAEREAVIDRQEAYTIAISVVSALLLAGLILLYRSFVHRKKSSQKLSEQKEEIASSNEQLNLMNSKLRQQQQQLQDQNQDLVRLNEVKNKLLSIISHDFRSPLSSLQGIIFMLKNNALSPEEIAQVFDSLSTKVENTTNMLDNLLKWTRNQMQGIRIDPEFFPLGTLVEDVISSQQILADRKEVALEQRITSPLSVYADPEMVRMVVRNLISNAIKFTLKNDSVTVEARQQGEKVVVSVVDTGTGITPEMMNKLFSLKDNTTYGTDNEKGTGLGLIICREFVESNGGEIWVESEVGKGSSFHFTLATQPDQFPSTQSEKPSTAAI